MLICWLVPCIAFAQESIYEKRTYAQLLTDYKTGKLPKQQLLSLSLKSLENRQDSIARKIAQEYKSRNLEAKGFENKLTPELKKFITSFPAIFSVNDALIRYIIQNPEISNRKFDDPGFSKKIAKHILTKDIIDPALKPEGKFAEQMPDWLKLERQVNNYADPQTSKALVIDAKLSWYNEKMDWDNVVKYNLEKIEMVGLDTAGIGKSMLNNMVYEIIFQHSKDTAALNKGLAYMQILLKKNPDADTWIDTYANLLYKVGKKNEAMEQEQKAINIAKSKNDEARVKEYAEALKKMVNDRPTWNQ